MLARQRVRRTVVAQRGYEEVYLKAYVSFGAERQGLAACNDFYNNRRPHQSQDFRTLDMIYFGALKQLAEAA
jgi:hypothetical protein